MASLRQERDGSCAPHGDLVARLRQQHQIPGLSVAIVANGRPVFAAGFGSRSIVTPDPVGPETQFRLASVSKAVTAVAVLQLAARDGLDLDRPARDYCPELQPLDGAPTVRHLLAHQSGMRHTTDREDETITGEYPRLGPALRGVVKERLRFAPGTKALYTSWGYAALGCVIETVTGRGYADAVSAGILAPAKMGHTTFDTPTFASPRFSPGFRLVSGRLGPSAVVDTRFKRRASGMISSVSDLAAFSVALFDGTLLPDTQFRQMLAVPPLPRGGESRFTAGWITGQPALGVPHYSYNGSMEGSTAYLLIVPDRQVAVALLANRERFVPEVHPLVLDLARLVVN